MMLSIYTRWQTNLSEGGFNLRKWDSNSQELRDKMASELSHTNQVTNISHWDKEVNSHPVGSSDTQSIDQFQTKLLGISYDSCSDEFTFCFSDLTTQISKFPASRRSL